MTNKPIVYSKPGCPACAQLKLMLKKNNIEYDEFNDIDAMIEMGIRGVPMLEVDGVRMKMKEALQWLEEQK